MPTLSQALAASPPRRGPTALQRIEQAARSREDQLRAALDLIGVAPHQVERQIDYPGFALDDRTQARFEVDPGQLNNALVRVGQAAARAQGSLQIAADGWYELATTVTNTANTWYSPQLYMTGATATTWTTTVTTNLPTRDWQMWANANPQWQWYPQVSGSGYAWGAPAVEDEVAARRRQKNEHLRRQAQRRGVKLLITLLDEAQIADYAKTGTFLAVAPSGTLYRLRKARTVLELDPVTMRQRNSLCVHMSYGYIAEDSLVANLIGILTDEQAWRDVANISGADGYSCSKGNFHTTSQQRAA